MIFTRDTVFLCKTFKEHSPYNEVSDNKLTELPNTTEEDNIDDIPIPSIARMVSDDEPVEILRKVRQEKIFRRIREY